MTESQGWQLIGIAWMAMAAFDKPHDIGTAVYMTAAAVALLAALLGIRERR